MLTDEELLIDLLDLFPEIDARNPPEFLVDLFESSYFRTGEGAGERLDPVKLIIFLILIISDDKAGQKFDHLLFLYNLDSNQGKIDKERTTQLTQTIL